MFRTAEAAGLTLNLLPEARYKTSFYSMSGGDGQTLSMVGHSAHVGEISLAAKRRKNGAHGVSRGYCTDSR